MTSSIVSRVPLLILPVVPRSFSSVARVRLSLASSSISGCTFFSFSANSSISTSRTSRIACCLLLTFSMIPTFRIGDRSIAYTVYTNDRTPQLLVPTYTTGPASTRPAPQMGGSPQHSTHDSVGGPCAAGHISQPRAACLTLRHRRYDPTTYRRGSSLGTSP